jgi:deoxycytidylate deaminase
MEEGPLKSRKYFRLIFEEVKNHPGKSSLASLHGTVLVRGGSVISCALNSPHRSGFSDIYATHECFGKHSELNAIRKVRKKIDLTGCVAYNLRIDKLGEVRISAPCPGCSKLFLDYGIKKCLFSVDPYSVGVWKPSIST